jgi:hypothetical protein
MPVPMLSRRRNFLLAWTMAAELPKIPLGTPCRYCCWAPLSLPRSWAVDALEQLGPFVG